MQNTLTTEEINTMVPSVYKIKSNKCWDTQNLTD